MDYILTDGREKESQLGFVVLVVLDKGHVLSGVRSVTPETARRVTVTRDRRRGIDPRPG